MVRPTHSPHPPRSTTTVLLAAVVWALGVTTRPRPAVDGLAELRRRGGPFVLAVWHHQLVLAGYYLRRELVAFGVPLTVLVSRSRDGELGTALVRFLGAEAVRGSSSRGGGSALRQLVRSAAAGRWPIVVPDGPRGPARQVKPGILALARLSAAPIVPIGLAARRAWRLRSWDRLVLPKPFSPVGLAAGAAFPVGAGEAAGDSELCRRLAQALDDAEAVALRQAGGWPSGG